MNPKPAPRKERASFIQNRRAHTGMSPRVLYSTKGITGSVLLIIFRSLISLCFITCLIRISFNLKKDQKNRPHDLDFACFFPKFVLYSR